MPDKPEKEAPRTAAARWYDGDRVYGMCAVPGGRLFVGGSGGGDVKVYDPRNGKLEATLSAQKPDGLPSVGHSDATSLGHTDAVLAITYDKSGVYTTGADLTIIQWSVQTFEFVRVYTGHKALVSTVYTIPSEIGTGLFSGSDDRTIKQWNTNSGKCMFTFKGHKTAVNCIVATEDGRWLYSGSKNVVKVWSIPSRRCHKTVDAHGDAVWSLRLVEQNEREYLLTASSDETIKVWEDPTNRCEMIRQLTGHKGQVRYLLTHHTILFSCAKDGSVCVWDMTNMEMKPLDLLYGHDKTVTCMTLQNNQLCTCSFDKHINRWDMTETLDSKAKKQPITQFVAWDPAKAEEERRARDAAQSNKHDESRYYTRQKKKEISKMPPHEAVLHYDALPINFVYDKIDGRCSASELHLETVIFLPFLALFIAIIVTSGQIADNFFITHMATDLFEGNELATQPWCTLRGVGGPWRNPQPMVPGGPPVPGGPRPDCDMNAGTVTVGKRFGDIATPGDFNDWAMTIFTSNMWPGIGHPDDAPPNRRPPMLASNYLVGAVRLRTHRAGAHSCKTNPAFLSTEMDEKIPYWIQRKDFYTQCYAKLMTGADSSAEKAVFACLNYTAPCVNQAYFQNMEFDRKHDMVDNYQGVTTAWAEKWFDEKGFKYFSSSTHIATGKNRKGDVMTEKFGGTAVQGPEQTGSSGWIAGGYAFEIPFQSTPNDAMDMMAAALDNGFVDDVATRFVVLEFFTYTPYIDTFSSYKYFCEVAPGGKWVSEAKYWHFRVWTTSTSNVRKTILDMFFLVFVFYYCRKFTTDWKRMYRQSKSFVKFIFDPWNILELVNMLCYIILYSYRFAWYATSVAERDIIKMPSTIIYYPSKLDSLRNYYETMGLINCINVVLTFLKFLKFLRLNERLNILTRTLDLASQSILGVVILFVWIVFAYALTGNTVFGGGIFEFRSVSFSFLQLMRYLIGDFDYPELRDENPRMCVIYFWSFQVLGMIILLNFIIAVLGDAFADVSKDSGSHDLDVALQKTMRDAKSGCMPKAWRQKSTLWRHRKTQTGLLRKVQHEVITKIRNSLLTDEQIEGQEHRDLLRHVFIHRDDFMGSISEGIKDDLSEEFLYRVWLDVAWEYHKDKCIGHNVEDEQKRELIRDNVGQHVEQLQDCMLAVQDVRTRFDELEAKVRPVVQGWQITKKEEPAEKGRPRPTTPKGGR